MIDTILFAGALFVAAQDGGAAINPDNRRECRAVGETGSRLGRRRVCATRAEWDAEDQAQRTTLNEGRQRMVSPTYDDLVRNSPNRPSSRCARC